MDVGHGHGIGKEHSELKLWKNPMLTIYYFLKEIPCSMEDAWTKLMTVFFGPTKRTITDPIKFSICTALLVTTNISGYFLLGLSDNSKIIKEQISCFSYWIFLGFLSSVGLGTGLPTFVLYLGPFIAKVTVAAQECQSIHFPKPPYPESVICPEDEFVSNISFWDIMGKIRWESLMWGFGTALGELPPYFVARAARISGNQTGNEELEEFEQLLQKKKADPSNFSWLERGKLWMEEIVEKVGFWGILACASIPNPLFDLAGITCGHFNIPFTTFFGATLIGKALIKTHLQMTFIILASNEDLLTSFVSLVEKIPTVGPLLSDPFVKLMDYQKSIFHNTTDAGANTSDSNGGIFGWLLEKVVMGMVIYFVVSIVNSMAESYQKRRCKENSNKDQ